MGEHVRGNLSMGLKVLRQEVEDGRPNDSARLGGRGGAAARAGELAG